MSKNLIIFCIFTIIIFTPLSINAEGYQVIDHKNNKELILKKSNDIVKKYHIATGKGRKGTKRERGDSKTPLGVYRISKLNKSNRFYYVITESALRTLMNPKCNPLKLPEDKYDLWKNLTITFDHSNMKG